MITVTLDKNSHAALKKAKEKVSLNEGDGKLSFEIGEAEWNAMFLRLADSNLNVSQTVYAPDRLNLVVREAS